MRKLSSLFIFLLLLSELISAQTANSEINLTQLNSKLIESLFIKKLNELRKQNGVSVLSHDNLLEKIANDQATYMSSVREVTHTQKLKNKRNLPDRIKFYKGTHNYVGENCLKTFIKKATYKKGSGNIYIVKTYEDLANNLFEIWSNSPGHYKNMINKSYDVQGISFVLSRDSALYVTQVFSAKPYIPPKDNKIIDSDYGILPKNNAICSCMNSNEAIIAMNSISTIQIGDSVFLKSENLAALKKIFNNPKDAVYLDIVLRSQYTCDNNNLLHGSEIYEGTMLKPVYFFDLYKLNRAKDGKNLYAPLTRIPSYFLKENYQKNMGYIKSGSACEYRYVRPIPSTNIDILYLFPKYLYDKDFEVLNDTFSGSINLFVPFDRNSTTVENYISNEILRKIEIYKPFLKNIKVRTYSSIEGNTLSNIKLQEQRANEIARIISLLTPKTIITQIESSENWTSFYEQIKNTPFNYLSLLSSSVIKERLQKKSLLDSMDYILSNSRMATIEIEIEATVDNKSSAELVLGSYKKASYQKDSLKAFRAQNRLIDAAIKRTLGRPEILNVPLPHIKKFLPMWANYLALAATNAESIYSYSARDTALKVIKIDSNYIPLQFNFCILSLRYLHLYKDTLIPIAQLERKMNRAYKMAFNHSDSALVNHMWLNYSLLSLYHHWELHQYDKLNKHLEGVKKYYPGADISESEALTIALLFNEYQRYRWAVELLLPFIKRNPKNEDLLFLFTQTYDTDYKLISHNEWVGYLKAAKKMNPTRFHDWYDRDDFQGLRREEVKNEYCN